MAKYVGHSFSRRHLLQGGAGAALGMWVGGRRRGWANAPKDIGQNPLMFVSPKVERFVDDLPILPRQAAGGVLTQRVARHRFHRELAFSNTLAFGEESYLGPVLEANSGEPVTLTFQNEIKGHPLAPHIDTTIHGVSQTDLTRPRTTIHLHGGMTEPGSDGHPLSSVRTGGKYTHTYSGKQPAMGLWYHDHSMGITRLNVYAGLAGHYLLRDEWDTGRPNNPLGLPAGDFELPLVLQDKIFTSDGEMGFRLATYVPEGSWEGGQAGDIPVVNGVAYPRHIVSRGLYRLRLLNGSNLRSYRLSFSNRMTFWQIGTDAGLLNAPVALQEILLPAGGRSDLLVDFSCVGAGERVELINSEPVPLQFLIAVGNPVIDEIMQFRVDSSLAKQCLVPEALRGRPGLPPALPEPKDYTRVRTMTVNQLLRFERFPPAIMSLNNLGFATNDVEMVKTGDVERWDIVNTTTDPHPIHVHMALLRVLSRHQYNSTLYMQSEPIPQFGQRWSPTPDEYISGPPLPPEPWETGLYDTIEAPPGHITRILVTWPKDEELDFDPDATFRVPDTVEAGAPAMTHMNVEEPLQLSENTQPAPDRARGYVWHCHVLDHEDHDMMLPLRLQRG